MTAIDATTVSRVTDVLLPERQLLLTLLGELSSDQWAIPTECPEYTVKGIASHVLGDDLSLLSRQRDGAVQGLVLVAEKMPGVDFRTLLDTFNDQRVEAWVVGNRPDDPRRNSPDRRHLDLAAHRVRSHQARRRTERHRFPVCCTSRAPALIAVDRDLSR